MTFPSDPPCEHTECTEPATLCREDEQGEHWYCADHYGEEDKTC
jgi:hypothetical protein